NRKGFLWHVLSFTRSVRRFRSRWNQSFCKRLILIAGILLVLWAIVRVVRRGSLIQNDKEHDHAVRLLKERYARGEIDREEYLQRLKDLRE
ncbi:SHOCT domain-containing protein, partial [Alicyclobacillus mali (ex Roth et al. 2021)]|uniref:SHOCT domain-containing protein n=1 Tax=Alicyclobacillus mali (ex Roth et al. 2021) TaxID=1123961 RepID=UPI001F5D9F0C